MQLYLSASAASIRFCVCTIRPTHAFRQVLLQLSQISMEKLSVKGLTISIGVLWSFCTLLMGVTAMFGYGTLFVKDLSTIYLGYDATPIGILLGLVYGFLDGAVAGFIISCLYNLVVERLG
jgi:hypothetical protein